MWEGRSLWGSRMQWSRPVADGCSSRLRWWGETSLFTQDRTRHAARGGRAAIHLHLGDRDMNTYRSVHEYELL